MTAELRSAVVICSGGLDSVTLAHAMREQVDALHVVSFNYGQRHIKETEFAERAARKLGAQYDCVDLRDVGAAIGTSALLDHNVPVPDGHYAEQSMQATVVPNRNAIMLSVAFGIAAARRCQFVATAVHGGDHYIYPDCRPGFIQAFALMEQQALAPDVIALNAPYLHLTKAGIVSIGAQLGVDFAETWSCYKGGDIHCGECGTCYERREAFSRARVLDPTIYANHPVYVDPTGGEAYLG